MAFYATPSAARVKMEAVFESGAYITFALAVLFIFSVFSGYMFREVLVGIGTDVWGVAIFTLPEHTMLIEFEY